jgi:hypothetical protein
MTVIRLVTKDQELIIAEKPLLASGDVNSVVLHVDFDSAWDRYIARTAVFYTSKDSTVYEKLLTNGECVIPDEVLTDTGTLFVGVRGVPVDGSAQKTSAMVKYKIVEGAKPGTYTIHVTPDLYQQYIEAIKGQFDPVTTKIREDFDAQMESWGAEIEAFKTGYIDIGSFTGDGKSSRTHTFNFPPRFLCIWEEPAGGGISDARVMAARGQERAAAIHANSSAAETVDLSWEENTVTVYGDSANKSGTKYWHAAFA